MTYPAQGSAEWHAQRAGIPTASRFADILNVSKAKRKEGTPPKPLATRKTYMYELAIERIAGPRLIKATPAMQRGIDLEPRIRQLYARQTNQHVTEAPFVPSACGRWGASPDGYAGAAGLVEIKTNEAHIYLGDLLTGRHTVPGRYRWQMAGQCLVTGRAWCDLAQYCDQLGSFRITRLKPTQDDLDEMREKLEAFCAELDETTQELKELLAELCIPVAALPELLPPPDEDEGAAETNPFLAHVMNCTTQAPDEQPKPVAALPY